MRRSLFFVTLALSAAACAIVACTADDNTQPGTFTNKDASLAADTGAPGTDGNAPADSNAGDSSGDDDASTGDDSSTPIDAPIDSPAVDAADAASPCVAPTDGGDAGWVTLQADWGFAFSQVTLNDGGGQLLSIHRCDSIQWTNKDNGTNHSIQPNILGDFTGTAVNTGGAYTPVQFVAEGSIGYHCGVHGVNAMRGTVTVLP